MPWIKTATLERLTFDRLEEAIDKYTVAAAKLEKAGRHQLAAEAHNAAALVVEEVDRRHTYKAAYGIN